MAVGSASFWIRDLSKSWSELGNGFVSFSSFVRPGPCETRARPSSSWCIQQFLSRTSCQDSSSKKEESHWMSSDKRGEKGGKRMTGCLLRPVSFWQTPSVTEIPNEASNSLKHDHARKKGAADVLMRRYFDEVKARDPVEFLSDLLRYFAETSNETTTTLFKFFLFISRLLFHFYNRNWKHDDTWPVDLLRCLTILHCWHWIKKEKSRI